MPKQDAVEIYSRIPKTHNCAQAVAAAFEQQNLVDDMKSCGGGRAPEGRCGALHAALQLVDKEAYHELCREFKARAGSEYCHELKKELKFPCQECVRLGDMLAQKFMKGTESDI